MSAGSQTPWHEANQRHLMAAVAGVHAALQSFLAGGGESRAAGDDAPAAALASPDGAAWSLPVPPALETLCARFGLSSFERKLLLMCAGVELEPGMAATYAAAHQDPRRPYPTFGLALAAFADAHWSALCPAAPLRRWQLLEVMPGDGLTSSPLRIAERVLHYLAGLSCLDERLRGLARPVAAAPGLLAPSQQAVAAAIVTAWSRRLDQPLPPIVALCGDELAAKREVAAAAAATLGLGLHVVAARDLGHGFAETGLFLKLWEREAVLGASALLIECDDLEAADTAAERGLTYLVESLRGPLLLAVRGPRRCPHRPQLLFEVAKPTPAEQGAVWQSALGAVAQGLNGEVAALVSQFSLGSTTILAAADQAREESQAGVGAGAEAERSDAGRGLAARLWDACRAQARPRLEGLAQRLEPAVSWDDLVLPDKPKQILGQIAIHVRQRTKVYQTWGFASRGARGLGISALFAGPSGTGKTMAGEVLANDLRLDLYRIDLSQVVSKYIGETEKHLSQVFAAAEEGAAILLFDEADALFGKRTEVKDSHDRYANIEVSYLLQRMETYRGLAILTTNRKSALDPAFLRRIRFVVDFPFPEAAQRAEIWRRVFPGATPTEELKIERLARLNAAGGHIRNIAMGAAFLAANDGSAVRMSHLAAAARSEFAKADRPLTEAEIAGWV